MPPQSQNGISPVRKRGTNGRQMLPSRGETLGSPSRQYGARNNSGHMRKHPYTQRELRVAYKEQTSDNNKSYGFNTSFDNNDQHSTSAGSVANSAATPSSVYMPSSVALSRDMSDLSGVSGGTHRGSSVHTIPGQIFDPSSLANPWKQAYTLSNTPPESMSRNGGSSASPTREKANGASIWVADNDVVEIFDDLESSLGLDRFQIMGSQHNRIPIMILLMNPSKQTYELMQIWVDRANDSIRDLVQVLQHKLPVRWKQAYDGLFQVRGNRFTQLINIIRLVKYDIQPHEILVAKPWAMTAKVTIAFAGSAIKHLTKVGVISSDINDGSSHIPGNRRKPKNEDAPLLLSKRAQDRVYFPEGILNHHHAVQFMTFSPPFESAHIDAIATTTKTNGNDSSTNIPSHPNIGSMSLSDTFDDPHSSVLASNNSNESQSNRNGCHGVANSRQGRQKSSESLLKHNNNKTTDKRNNNNATQTDVKSTISSRRKVLQRDSKSNNCSDFFLKLNCFRRPTSSTTNRQLDTAKLPLQPSVTSLSEEEEQRWIAYSMKPIAEDQSLASGSVVSMSAPLLSQPLASQLARRNDGFQVRSRNSRGGDDEHKL